MKKIDEPFHTRPQSLLIILFCLLNLTACGSGGGGAGGGPKPTTVNVCLTTGAGQTITGKLPGSGGSYSIGGTMPAKGSVTIDAAGNFMYTPRSGLPSGDGRARGMDVFSYRVNDGNGSSEGVVTVFIDGAVRIMPLGDSITTGVSGNLSDAQQVGYRLKLYRDLDALSGGYGINFVGSLNSQGTSTNIPDRDHEGHPGWCDDNNPACTVSGGQTVDGNITNILNNNPPDIILLHIGTNHFDVNASGVNSILDKIGSWGQSNYPVYVFLARIIPSLDGSLDISTFNNNVRAISGDRAGARVFMVDQQSMLRSSADANKADPAWMTDNLHPSQAGYERMADRWKGDMISSGVLPGCS